MATRKQTKTTSRNKMVQCKKAHGHLVCQVRLSKNKKMTFLKLLLVPSKANKHRPHLIRRSGLVSIAALLVVLQFAYNYNAAGKFKILGYATNVSAQEVSSEINEARRADGENALSTDDQLNKAASLKADDMFKNGYWSHNSPQGAQPWVWFQKAGYSYQNAGENLAKDFRTSKGLTNAWLESETHRQNMLNPEFKNMGIAVVNGKLQGEETTLVVALFGTRQTEAPATIKDGGLVTSATTSSGSNIFENPAQINALTNPISILTLLILLGVLSVALLTHWHYVKLPKKVRKSWYKHHALYTACLTLVMLSYTVYILTSGSI